MLLRIGSKFSVTKCFKLLAPQAPTWYVNRSNKAYVLIVDHFKLIWLWILYSCTRN